MKKGVKHLLAAIITLVLIIVVIVVGLQLSIKPIIKSQLDAALGDLDNMYVHYDDIKINLIRENFEIVNFDYCSQPEFPLQKDSQGIELHLGRVSVQDINFLKIIRQRKFEIDRLVIMEPSFVAHINEVATKRAHDAHPDQPLDQPASVDQQEWQDFTRFVRTFDLDNLEIINAQAGIRSVATQLSVNLDSMYVRASEMEFQLKDQTFHFNDSTVLFRMGAAHVKTPDGLIAVETRDLHIAGDRQLHLGPTHVYNCVPKTYLSNHSHQPGYWIDLRLDSARTSYLEVEKIIGTHIAVIDEVDAYIHEMHMFRDERFKATKPYHMPQLDILKMNIPLRVNNLNAHIRQMNVEVALTSTNVGKINLRNITARLTPLTLIKGETLKAHMHIALPKSAKIDMNVGLHLTDKCDFDFDLHAKNPNLSLLNSLMRPLVGMTMDCQVHSLDMAYHGDGHQCDGQFVMTYDSLDVVAHKDPDIPFQIVSKNAGFITSFTHTCLCKRNPKKPGQEPLRYHIHWKYKDSYPFELYMFLPAIDGAIKTLMPGLFIHERIKPGHNKTQLQEMNDKLRRQREELAEKTRERNARITANYEHWKAEQAARRRAHHKPGR